MKNDLRQTKLYLFLEAVDSLDDIFLLLRKLRKATYLLLLALFIKSLYSCWRLKREFINKSSKK